MDINFTDLLVATILMTVIIGAILVMATGMVQEHRQRMKLFDTDYGKCLDACRVYRTDNFDTMECLDNCKPLADCIRLLPFKG